MGNRRGIRHRWRIHSRLMPPSTSVLAQPLPISQSAAILTL